MNATMNTLTATATTSKKFAFTYDHVNQKIVGTDIAFQKAGIPGSALEAELNARMEARPNYGFTVIPTEKKPEKKAEKPVVKQEVKVEEKVETAEEGICTDTNAARICAFLNGLLEHLDSKAEIKVYESEKGRYKVILEGQKLGALIGRRGETLDAIQQLTNYAVNSGTEKRIRVHVDAENYRAKREQSLEALAAKVAAKVVKYRRSVTLEPMNAYERHVIHSALQEVSGITTYSIGTEPNRRVVVAYDRDKR